MPDYTPEQVDIIRNAVLMGREAVQRAQRDDTLVFARAFVRHGGVQIPGDVGGEPLRKRVADQLLESLRTGQATSDDTNVRREIKRCHTEARWASAAASDKVVGFHLTLGPMAAEIVACREFLGQDYGLGAAVFPKERVVVLPSVCSDYQFVPVLEDEVEQ